VVLGYNSPILLRPTSTDGEFFVVGECYIHGFGQSEALLGPLPLPWEMVYVPDNRSYPQAAFKNTSTGEVTVEDPRLPPLPAAWERFASGRTAADPVSFVRFRNKETGSIVNYDPRMMPEALEAQGTELETFLLL
jgi:hypothetical protein